MSVKPAPSADPLQAIETAVSRLTSVMGPDDAKLRVQIRKVIGADPSAITELTDTLNAIAAVDNPTNRAAAIESIIARFMRPVAQLHATASQQSQSKIKSAIVKAKTTIDSTGLGAESATR